MSVPVRNFLKARRDRALGAIMGFLEREVFPKRCPQCRTPVVTPQEQAAIRKVVLESLNSYHDSTLDLFKSDEGTVRNDELISLLGRVEDALAKRWSDV